jgi:hypothetical protein
MVGTQHLLQQLLRKVDVLKLKLSQSSNCGLIFRKVEIPDQPDIYNPSHGRKSTLRSARGGNKFKGDSNRAQKARHSSENDPEGTGDTPYDEEDEESHDSDEISEYKRIRLFKQSGIHWDPLSCHEKLRISKNGLGVSYPGPPTPLQAKVSAYSIVRATKPMGFKATGARIMRCFEIRILHGDVCVGFCTESAPVRFMPGAEQSIYAYRCNDGGMLLKGMGAKQIPMDLPRIGPGDVVGLVLAGPSSYLLVNEAFIGTCGTNCNARKISHIIKMKFADTSSRFYGNQ